MTVQRWGRLLLYLMIPLSAAILVIGILVGGLLEIAIGAMSVIVTALCAVFVRKVPDEALGSVEPTLGTSVVRIAGMVCLFTLIAYVMISFGAVEATAIVTRPSVPFATVSIALGATVGVGFPFVIDRVAHPRIVHSFENLLVIGLFAGLLVIAPENGIPYLAAFVVARSGVYAVSIT